MVYAKEDTSISTGYINTINAKTGESTSYQGLRKDKVIYMLPDDIAAIGEYGCESLSMEKEKAENVLKNNSFLSQLYSKLNLDKLFKNNKFEYLLFSRKETTTDYITQIYYYDGYAQTMNKSFKIDTVNYGGKTYLNLEKMLYLMHAQWYVEESILYCYPLDHNIFDFIGENFKYMYDHSVQHNSLLYEGENGLGHSTRIVLSHILNDVDMRIFIPFYGSDMIQQDWYEEAILQLATTDDSFIDEAGSEQINEYLKDSPFHIIKTGLSVSDTTLETITQLPSKISDTKLNKFSKWNDFSTISTAQLEATQKKLGDFDDIVSVANILVDFNEINTRSKEWGNDFVNGLDILYTINEDVYGDYGKDISKVADDLLDEYENPTEEAAEAAMLDTYGLVLDKLIDELLDKTVIGHIESIIALSNVIIKSNPNYASQIENADLMNTVHALINVENVYLNEFVDAYHDYLHYLGVEEGTSSLRLWELMFTSINDNPQKEVETHAISDMRNALEMFLKTSLRNKTYVYHFNYYNNGGSFWTPTSEAKELKEDIYKTYALLSELISTRDYDNLIYLDETFETMYSNQYGLIREKLDNTLLTSEEINFENQNTSSIDTSEWKEILTTGYWENKIQSHYVYKFFENGTVESYPTNFEYPIIIENLVVEDTYSYTIEDGYLVINDLNVKLRYVSKDENYKWDTGIEKHLPTDEKFFYEVDFVESELPVNAFYISRLSDYLEKSPTNNNDFSVSTLREKIIGSWGGKGAMMSEYDFMSDGTCYWESQKDMPGTFKILDNKTLIIELPFTTNKYVWSEESFDEFHSHSDGKFWCFTGDDVLKLNGKEYYRNGKVTIDTNIDGDLVSILKGTWYSDHGFKEYRFFDNGTYEENTVVVSSNMLINRSNVSKGKIDIVDNANAKLWQDLPEGYGYLPHYSELVYNANEDKIYIGGSNNGFTRAKYKE